MVNLNRSVSVTKMVHEHAMHPIGNLWYKYIRRVKNGHIYPHILYKVQYLVSLHELHQAIVRKVWLGKIDSSVKSMGQLG